MTAMKPLTKGNLGPRAAEGHKACDKAFALAYRYSGGRDLVEETIVANCRPLGRNKPTISIEKVHLSVFGEGVGVPFPRFGFEKEDWVAEKLVKSAEARAREILGEMYDKEYLAHQALAGTMPWFNRVFEEFGIHHEEHDVPMKVHKPVDDKAKKAVAKNASVAAKTNKRKGASASKVVSKK
jgi:hypothetical protein